jgi:LmbE family N-acetylglucosaminyl deacetylase
VNRWIAKINDALKAVLITVVQSVFAFLGRNAAYLFAKGPILVIAPHPDDETLGCGAAIARARAASEKVHIVVITDGGASITLHPLSREELVALRQQEMIAACKVLGVAADDITFLGIPDTKAREQIPAIEKALADQIERLKPQLILSPYGVDHHEDHKATARAVDKLYKNKTITCPVLEYPIWFWWRAGMDHLFNFERLHQLRCLKMGSYRETKRLAIRAHRSQCPHLFGESFPASFFQPLSFEVQYFKSYEIFFEKSDKSRLSS